MTIIKREDAEKKYTWAIEDLFASDEQWQNALEDCKQEIDNLASFKGKLGSSSEELLQFLRLSDEVSLALDRLANYCLRKCDEDTANTYYQGLKGKFMTFYVKSNSALAFETPELINISDEKMEQFYKENTDLTLYKRALDKIRARKQHTLSENEEKLLAAAGEMANAPEELHSLFNNADLNFPPATDKNGKPHTVTHSTYITLVESSDRVLRKSAFESIYHTYENFKNTSAGFLNSQINQLRFYAKARKYNDTLEAALDSTEVPISVYHNLISCVHDNLPYMYKYMALRKKLMKLEQMHMYDLYTPIIADSDEKIDYEAAKKEVLNAVKPLGEEYQKILQEGFDNRWIDVYENKGKRSGAYSSAGIPHPYVLLNYKDTLDSEFTLAHEMGHALHSYHSIKNQPVVYADYVIFVAEVASTCNEALLTEYLLNKTTDKLKRAALINHFLEQFRTTIYRQTMFAEFELEINRSAENGQPLTAENLCRMYHDLNELYYGPDVVIDSEIDMEWARVPHFFYNYYVFQYATGFSAAIALSQKILQEGQPAVENYIKFLSGGCSTDPINLLKIAGVDMTSPQPINTALEKFAQLIDELEELVK